MHLDDLRQTLVRTPRRVWGYRQASQATVSGAAPAATLAAIRSAAIGRPSADEAVWIARIEALRSFLTLSSEPITFTDHGAGPGAAFDDGSDRTEHVVERTIGEMTRVSKPQHWGYLLHRLVRELAPRTVLELGSCVGLSAAYQASALHLNGAGRLITLEGAEPLAERARRTLLDLGLDHQARVVTGPFRDTLDQAMADLRPIEMAFIDGNHAEGATLSYMESILDHVADEAILIFDDISWSAGMRRAWSTIAASDRFALTIDLRSVGIAVVSRSATDRHALRVAYA